MFFFRFILETGSSINSLYVAFRLLDVKVPAEVSHIIANEKINGTLNAAIHFQDEMNLNDKTDFVKQT